MLQKIRKNKFLKKTLVFASVFLILTLSIVLPCFAQAPNFGNSNFTPSSRYGRTVYCYYDNNLVLYLQYDLETNSSTTVAKAGTLVFSEYFYNNFYTGNIVNDMAILDMPFSIYGTIINGGTIYQSVTNDVSLYTYVSSRNMTQAYLDTIFVVSYENQFTYWENLLIPINQAKTEGYTQALNDMNAFRKGLFDIFNAPFEFVRNLTGAEIFGINIFGIFCFFFVFMLGLFLFSILRGLIF